MTVPVYMLVCDELPERQAAVRAHLKERGVEATWWKGFHGTTWGLETCKEHDPGKRISPGHVGLNLGVWAMWQHAFLSAPGQHSSPAPSDPIIFFEDDAVLPVGFHAHINDLRDELETTIPDWDLVFIGLAEAEPHVWHKVIERIGSPDSRLCTISNPFGTHALMVRRRALPVLMDKMRVAERNLDQQLWSRVLQPGHLKWCAVLPTLVTQRTFDYGHTGRPEWQASTLRPGEAKPPEPMPDGSKDLPGRPSDATIRGTLGLIDPFACLYRGEPLEDQAIAPSGKSVPLHECARFNVPCHTRRGIVLPEVTACESCNYRLEMAPSRHRERLAIPEGHFNPSIAMWDGKLVMATRDSWGHSKVALWELENSKNDWTGLWSADPIGSYGSKHPAAPRLEDPRLFTARHPKTGDWHLHAALNLPDAYPPKVVQVGYVRFAKDLSGIEDTVVYPSPFGNLYEKNWQCIPVDGGRELRWLYSFKPHHTVMGETQNWRTLNPFQWTGGVIRGGATPVRVYPWEIDPKWDGLPAVYYHFFHGCLKRERQNVYTVGCNVFEAEPPYRVLRQTSTPLIWPDLPAADENVVKRMVIWPGGAIPHQGAWHISLGIDDTFVRIVRLPFADVEKALDAGTHDNRDILSIRDTAISHGIPAQEKR